MAAMMSVWMWLLISLLILHNACCSCFLPQVYKVGVLNVGLVSRYPTWKRRLCDDVMLCGRTPVDLRILTMETSLNKTAKFIQEHTSVNLWMLTSRVGLDTKPVADYLTAHQLFYQDFSRRKLPETDAEWCFLILSILRLSDDGKISQNSSAKYVLSVVRQAHLKNVVIIHDNVTDTEVADLSDSLSSIGIMFVMFSMDPNEGLVGDRPFLHFWTMASRVVDFKDYTDVLLWCRLSCVNDFLQKVAKEGTSSVGLQHMTRFLVVHPSMWSNVSLGNHNYSHVASDNVSKAGFRSSQTDCLSHDLQNILAVVRHFYHVAVLWKTQDCVRLQTLMLTKNGGRTLSYAGFSRYYSDIVLTSEVFPNTKWRLNGQKFAVATAIWEPFVMKTEVQGKVKYVGLCIDMLQAMAKSLNFTYNLTEPADGQYGSIENGNWTGLVRMLKDKDAELVVAPIAVNELRATVVDFSTPFYQDYTGILFQRPDPALHKWKTYFMPFSWQVFVLLAVSFVIGAAFGHVIGVWSVDVLLSTKRPFSKIMDTVQYFFGSLLAQGGVWQPVTASARMFVSAWWLFCVVMAAIYSGNLTASFAVSVYDPSFTTVKEMLDEDAFDFGTVPGTIWFDIFKFSNRSDFKRIEHEIIRFVKEHEQERINETSYHVQRTTQTDYAFVSNMGSLSLTVAQECQLMILKEKFLPLQYAVALQKDSPLTDTVSTWILQMNEGGLDDLWSSYWWRTADQKCEFTKKTKVKIVHLEDCQSAFYVLPLGLAAAIIAILAEKVFHWLFCRTSEEDCVSGRVTRNSSSSAYLFQTSVQDPASSSMVSNHNVVFDFNGLKDTFRARKPCRVENSC